VTGRSGGRRAQQRARAEAELEQRCLQCGDDRRRRQRPDGTLQLVSCDPGAGFDAGTRPGVARELVSWRLAELITNVAVTLVGGGDAEFADAWAFVRASAMPLELMTLPATTSPADMVVAARAGFDALIAPAG